MQDLESLPKMEEAILKFWKHQEIFKKVLEKPSPRGLFRFYEGPPFATGLPHYGHLACSIIKDAVLRFHSLLGYHAPSRFGWDCHGLPVEHQVNQELGLQSRHEIIKYGIKRYNEHCKKAVLKHLPEWKETLERIGRWVDLDHAYFTMEPSFMQSVWWVFQALWNQGLIYQGFKIVPFSTGLSTGLSNFEANLNYKEVQDPSITIRFQLKAFENTFMLAWTTTPWTLPSNCALAIHPEIRYQKIRSLKDQHFYILASDCIAQNFEAESWELVEEVSTSSLVGKHYEPLFPFYKDQPNAFQVVLSRHVTTSQGTGVVHIAPAFGEDDFEIGKRERLGVIQPLTDDGVFTAEVPFLKGLSPKAADPLILKALKAQGSLFKNETLTHAYPFCWRTGTPLIYRAISSWFVSVESIKSQMLENIETSHWIPGFVRDGRFSHWIENSRDWAISRSRFWGTPLPIWKNEEGESICIGSIAELEARSGQKISDLHIDTIDSITLTSPTGKSPLKRIPEVLDCWFESGSMPYASLGYPFAESKIEDKFPADFIAEGLDQTRGWFYTLFVLGTALFKKAPFKNVIVHGLVLASDGKKMSKSLKNYPDPQDILKTHGADALRLYLLQSTLVKAQELRFSEQGVQEITRKILLKLIHAVQFFTSYAQIDSFQFQKLSNQPSSLLNQWMLSRAIGSIATIQKQMKVFELDGVVEIFTQLFEDLNNTYIRLSKSIFWQEGMTAEKQEAFETLFYVLLQILQNLSSFAPFLSESLYQDIKGFSVNSLAESIFLTSFSEPQEHLIDSQLEAVVKSMNEVLVLGRNFRENARIKTKIPLKKLLILSPDAKIVEGLQKFEAVMKTELNVLTISFDTNIEQWIDLQCKANFPVLGPKCGPHMKTMAQIISQWSYPDLQEVKQNSVKKVHLGPTTIFEIGLDDIQVLLKPKKGIQNMVTGIQVSIQMDSEISPEQLEIGTLREALRKIQNARKNAKLKLSDRIELQIHCSPSLQALLSKHQEVIEQETLSLSLTFTSKPQGDHVEQITFEQEELVLALTPQSISH